MHPDDDPDVQLMLAAKAGDRSAFETLFAKYIRHLVGFNQLFVGSRARAEELAQETFVHLYRTRDRYEPRARFAAFLYRIATNLCLSEVRRAEHRMTHRGTDTEDEEFDISSLPDATTADAQEHVLAAERVERMRDALDRLPAQQRAAILLARGEGMSYVDVAEALGCSVSAVKSLIHRATVTLRKQLCAITRDE